MNNSDYGSVLLCFVGLAVFAGLIALAVFLIKKSSDEAKQSEIACNRILQSLPQDKQMLFIMQYNSAKKNPTTAVVLALFLEGSASISFTWDNTGLGVLYLIFCWTYIPSIIALIEAFVISGQVGKYNQQKAMEIASMFGGAFPRMVTT